MNEDYNLANIRMLLIEGFDEEELCNLCFDISILRPVLENRSERAGKSELARRIVEYANNKLVIETVLDWARAHNPAMYEKHQPYKVVYGQPSSSASVKPDPAGPRTTKIVMVGAVLVLILAILFVMYPPFLVSRQSSTEATQTADVKQAQVTAATSAAPDATSTLTPMPHPQAKISEPIDGESATTNPEIIVEYTHIPADRYLWVAVRIPKVRPTGLIYPQLKDMKLPPHLVGTGIYHTYVALGAKEDTGVPFNIIVLLADQQAGGQMTAYAKSCSFNVNSCTGMPLPETGVEILDFITVVRK